MKLKPKTKQLTPAQNVALAQSLQQIFKMHVTKAFNYKQLAKALKYEDEYFAAQIFEHNYTEEDLRQGIVDCLQKMCAAKIIAETDKGKYKIVPVEVLVEGTIDFSASGSAYVKNADFEQDIYISPNNTLNALNGDTVKISLFAHRANRRAEGEVVEVVKRARTEFVGTVHIQNKIAFLIPSGVKNNTDIFILPGKLHGAKDGEKAVAKIVEWLPEAKNPAGEIVRVLGMPGNHSVEMDAILVEYGFPLSFDKEVEDEADKIPLDISAKEIKDRRDMRGITTFTIDPEDAKDFDDALSIQKLPNGNYEIGIHIADVSHYVVPGTALDKEAYSRATSIYLVDRVIPMLPEKLSNHVCSLRPHEDKLCFSAVFEMTEAGELINEWFGRTVIYSDNRFSYEQAQQVLEDKKGTLATELLLLNKIAKSLRKQRFINGSINFDKVEVKFKLDEEKMPVGVFLKVMKDSNQLIEEFMLLANKRVATFVGKYSAKYLLNTEGKTKDVAGHKTFVYRIHDVPDPEKIKTFAQFAAKFGYKMDVQSEKNISKSINKLIKDVAGKPEQNLLETLAIRSMAKAKYDTNNIGHYGLAFDYYSHFTSPIRRYPDVLAHRLLQYYLDGKASEPVAYYAQACKHSSAMEVQATEAERASIKFKQVQYLQARMTEVFDGIVSGVSEWGMFVELVDSKCEGMIRLRDLNDDYYELDEKNYCLRGSRSGNTFQLGDKLQVMVKNTDLQRKQIDFMVYDEDTPMRARTERQPSNFSHPKRNQKYSGKKSKKRR